jgi:hypothetical protein
MKNFLVLCSLFICFSGFYSCTKDTAPAATAVAVCDSTKIGFAVNVEPILAAHCALAGCHDANYRQSGIDYTSYIDAKTSVNYYPQNNVASAICRMQGTACGDQMPQVGRTLSTATIDTFIIWQADGFCP